MIYRNKKGLVDISLSPIYSLHIYNYFVDRFIIVMYLSFV